MRDSNSSKLDRIESTLNDQAVTLGKLTVAVEEHVRRTNLLEEELEPVKSHVAMVNGALKFIALCGILATIIESIHFLFK